MTVWMDSSLLVLHVLAMLAEVVLVDLTQGPHFASNYGQLPPP